MQKSALLEKAKCLPHFSFEKCDRKLKLPDIQGAGYTRCDLEIAFAEFSPLSIIFASNHEDKVSRSTDSEKSQT